MKNIIPKKEDNYIVVSDSIITSFDRKVLTRLYQPIIGSIAFSLYLTLLSELEFDRTISKEDRPHSSLCAITKMNIDDLVLATSKLEGVGLIKTKFSKKNNLFSYTLFSPCSPAEFFDSPLLDNQYKSSLGENEYQRNKMYFTKQNIKDDDFEDISENFNDVYTLNHDQTFEGNKNQLSTNKAKIKINFDFDIFYEKLAEFQIPKKIITKDIESLIASLSITYNIAAVDMPSLIHRSLDSNGKVSQIRLKELCQRNVFAKPIEKRTYDTGNDNLNKLLELYNSKDPYEFLIMKNNNTALPDSDRRIISSLLQNFRLEPAVINALIDYTLEVNNNILNKSYVEKIAASLQRSHIEDAMGAIRYLRSSKTTNKPQTFDLETKSKVEVEANNKKDKDLDADIEESLRIIAELNKGKVK